MACSSCAVTLLANPRIWPSLCDGSRDRAVGADDRLSRPRSPLPPVRMSVRMSVRLRRAGIGSSILLNSATPPLPHARMYSRSSRERCDGSLRLVSLHHASLSRTLKLVDVIALCRINHRGSDTGVGCSVAWSTGGLEDGRERA